MKILKALKLLEEKNIVITDREVDMPLDEFQKLFDDYDKTVVTSPIFGTRITYSTQYRDYTIKAYRYDK